MAASTNRHVVDDPQEILDDRFNGRLEIVLDPEKAHGVTTGRIDL
jgi:hypothetical protein